MTTKILKIKADIENIEDFITELLDQMNDMLVDRPNMFLFSWVLFMSFFTFVFWNLPQSADIARKELALILSVAYGIPIWDVLVNGNFVLDNPGFQFRSSIPLLPEYYINFSVGIDGLSMVMLILTVSVIPICVVNCNDYRVSAFRYRQIITLLFITEILLVCTFISMNVFFFFVFFESTLIPVFIIIGLWGSGERRLKAAYYFFLYTLMGSFFMLYGIYLLLDMGLGPYSLEYDDILRTYLSREEQITLFWFFVVPFMVKIPMVPFHLWLPQAHVEAPTAASIILAVLLLKLGGYGFLRFILSIGGEGAAYYAPVMDIFALGSVIHASLTAIIQTDLKRMIAYSSIAHMNFVVLGLFSRTHQAIDGAIYLMVGHGVVSAALFFCAGVLYNRYHTRSIKHYSGLAQVMPLFSLFFFLFTLANMSFPGTSNFIGEFLILAGVFEYNSFLMVIMASGIVLSAVYSIWLFNRIVFGTLKRSSIHFADLNRVELAVLCLLTVLMLILGVYSSVLTQVTAIFIKQLLMTNTLDFFSQFAVPIPVTIPAIPLFLC